MIKLTPRGLYCEEGGFHVDPSGKVDIALITHAHSDHARPGSRLYYCAERGLGLLAHRLGARAEVRTLRYGETLRLGKTWVSFHPAGHILGSAQVRIEVGSRVTVVSGDYKREHDPTCEAFEVIPCDTFITEATFGNPRYQWKATPAETASRIHSWWRRNAEEGKASLLFAYSLGKSQRILAELRAFTDRRALVFGEAAALTEIYRKCGVAMLLTERLESFAPDELQGELIVGPHSILKSAWQKGLAGARTAFASGWMASSAGWMRGRYDEGFVISDHADWPALLRTIRETGARTIQVLHSSDPALVRHLRMQGMAASVMSKESPNAPAGPSWVQGDLFAGWES